MSTSLLPRRRRTLAALTALAGASLTLTLLPGGPVAAAKARPDLQVRAVSALPAEIGAEQQITTTARVRNVGTKGAGRSTVRAFLSTTPTARATGTVWGERTVRMPKKTTKDVVVSGTVPTSLVPDSAEDPDTYFLVVCVQRRGSAGGKNVCRVGGASTVSGAAPGGRSAGDPLFPQTGNTGYDARHYDVELAFTPGDGTPVGQELLPGTTTTMTALATQGLSELSLDFQPFDVASVLVDGEEAAFAYADTETLGDPEVATQLTKLVVTPATPIPNGEEFTVEVAYTGTPEAMVDVDESLEGWIPACYTPTGGSRTCDGAFVVNEPNGAQTFFPSNNYPTDKATFDTTLTVPTGKTAIGIGEQTAPPADNGDGTTTWRWSEDTPTATYLTTASIGDFSVEQTTIRETSTGRDLPAFYAIDSSASPVEVASVNASLRRTQSITNWMSQRFGAYPLDSTGAVVDRTTGVGYALEVQTKPHYATPSVNVGTHLHEIAHQWFGNNATLAQWTDIWFNEGWAQWLTWQWGYEENGSVTSPALQFETRYANPSTDWSVAPAELDGDPANLFANFPTYVRGGMTLEGYRQIVGDDTFYDFARDLQVDYADGNISTTAFVADAVAASGFTGEDRELLETYFQQWLYGTVKPTVVPSSFD